MPGVRILYCTSSTSPSRSCSGNWALADDGDELLVVGRARREPDPRGPAAGYRAPPTIPVLEPPGKRPLVITEIRRPAPE